MSLPQVLVNDLVVTKEGPNMKHFVEVIEDYFNVQGSLESSVQLPHQPVNVAIAADAHRYMINLVHVYAN